MNRKRKTNTQLSEEYAAEVSKACPKGFKISYTEQEDTYVLTSNGDVKGTSPSPFVLLYLSLSLFKESEINQMVKEGAKDA